MKKELNGMNEIVFLIYLFVVTFSCLVALKFGKEGLIGLICIQVILMNLLVPEEISLLGISATPVDALAVGTSLGLNLLNEYYGKLQAQRAIVISSLGAFFYMIITVLHLAYIPATTDVYYSHFNIILSIAPRIIVASFVAYYVSQKVEAILYAFLKNTFLSEYFVIRNYISMAITQLLDTMLFSFLGLYKIIDNIWQVILVAYTIKIITILLAVPMLVLIRNWGKNFFEIKN